MPTFLDQHNSGVASVGQVVASLEQALANRAHAMLPALNESIMVCIQLKHAFHCL
jgi:hypothetical protein